MLSSSHDGGSLFQNSGKEIKMYGGVNPLEHCGIKVCPHFKININGGRFFYFWLRNDVMDHFLSMNVNFKQFIPHGVVIFLHL